MKTNVWYEGRTFTLLGTRWRRIPGNARPVHEGAQEVALNDTLKRELRAQIQKYPSNQVFDLEYEQIFKHLSDDLGSLTTESFIEIDKLFLKAEATR